MIHEVIPIHVEGSAGGTHLTTYIHEYTEEIQISQRTTVLILPGGAYAWKSAREAEPVALRLMAMGCNAAVLRYSTEPTRFPIALREVAAAMAVLHDRAQVWHIDPDRIAVCGFSAGGHLAASYGCYWNQPEYVKDPSIATIYPPAALILGYPVITSDERWSHQDSIHNILGEDYGDAAAMQLVSLERQVGRQVPRTFIWNTVTDDSVPAVNSVLFVQALMEAGVSTEFHMYDRGAHGLSLATRETAQPGKDRVQEECASWTDLLEVWLRNM